MKLHAFWIAAIALCLAACSKQEPPVEPQEAQEPEVAAEAVEAVEAVEAKVAQMDEEFIDHMHAHADFLDDLMFALAEEDLDGAMTPAYWLSHHEGVNNVPVEWQQYIVGMREAARAVERATDLETARTLAAEITNQCQGCHEAAGIAQGEQ